MKYYKDLKNRVYVFEDDDIVLNQELVSITAEEKAILMVKPLDQVKIEKKLEILMNFDNSFITGTFLSTILNIEVDNRRSGTKNDMANLESAIELGEYPILWKGSSEVATINTHEEALAFKREMILDGKAKYEKKWMLESQIESATTVAELESIVW